MSPDNAILDASQVVELEFCNRSPSKRDKEPSLGALGLPSDILRMTFNQLSFHKSQNTKAVKIPICSHIVSVPDHQKVRVHAPSRLVVLSIAKLSEYSTTHELPRSQRLAQLTLHLLRPVKRLRLPTWPPALLPTVV